MRVGPQVDLLMPRQSPNQSPITQNPLPRPYNLHYHFGQINYLGLLFSVYQTTEKVEAANAMVLTNQLLYI